jgi:molybdopterin synthase sulfur carrier subunit
MSHVRVVLPYHLRTIAKVSGEISLELPDSVDAVTQRAVLDALEARYPALRGTIRDRATASRRPFVRFYACAQDLSHESPDDPLPAPVVHGDEPFLVVGAMAGG